MSKKMLKFSTLQMIIENSVSWNSPQDEGEGEIIKYREAREEYGERIMR